jgi:hypothetical protein
MLFELYLRKPVDVETLEELLNHLKPEDKGYLLQDREPRVIISTNGRLNPDDVSLTLANFVDDYRNVFEGVRKIPERLLPQ